MESEKQKTNKFLMLVEVNDGEQLLTKMVKSVENVEGVNKVMRFINLDCVDMKEGVRVEEDCGVDAIEPIIRFYTDNKYLQKYVDVIILPGSRKSLPQK